VLNTVSSTVWDAQGYIEIYALDSQTVGDLRRRGNRVATLDGGAVINDAGFSDADRTFEIRWSPTDEIRAAVCNGASLNPRRRVSCAD
jgi:adenylylsulfate kinase-like enzyme